MSVNLARDLGVALVVFCALAAQGPDARAQAASRPMVRLKPVPFTDVVVADAFWAPRRAVNAKVSLPLSLDRLEEAGNVRNFELAAAGAREGYSGPVYMDSDLYKGLEAAAYVLAERRDPVLEARLDGIIAKIAAAQRPDGYLNTHFQVKEPERRWTNLRDAHELYCAGHLFEAAVAHAAATGKRTLLEVATKLADHLVRTFGDGPGRRLGYPGHPETELALVKLADATGDARYFDLARFFVERRGARWFATEHGTPLDRYDGTYWLDDVPITDHREIKGHAVRAGYLFAGATDVAARTEDPSLLAMLDRVWRNTTRRRTYVTGGVGPSAHNEGFTVDYDLPNATAYQETCASVAMILWNRRLGLLYGDGSYGDALETALYNGFLAGVSLDGETFFYVNPLASRGGHRRSKWFGCACCPPNVLRTLAALGGYAYATSADGLWVDLYVQGSVKARVAGRDLTVDVTTGYPFDGRASFAVRGGGGAEFELRMRIPAWAGAGARATVGGADAGGVMERGYLVVRRRWSDGDVCVLDLPMPPRRVEAHPAVVENRGRVALARGPLVYCFEQVDHATPLADAALPVDALVAVGPPVEGLAGVPTLRTEGVASSAAPWSGALYREAPPTRRVALAAIPYYAWANRADGPMLVWLPTSRPPAPVLGLERNAKVALSAKTPLCAPEAVRDGKEPKSSGDHPGDLCHFWPRKGGTEWIEYRFEAPVAVAGVDVYWFDDEGVGECRTPESWRVLAETAEGWTPVTLAPKQAFATTKDGWISLTFAAPTTARGFRLEAKARNGFAIGVHEWRLRGVED